MQRPAQYKSLRNLIGRIIITIISLAIGQTVVAQVEKSRTPPSKYKELGLVDFSGSIRKYDVDFDGVGPKVYFLPPPPPREELLRRTYVARQHTKLEIARMLAKRDVLADLKAIENQEQSIAPFSGSDQSLEGWLLQGIDFAEKCGNLAEASDLQLVLAREYFRLGALDQALEFYELAKRNKLKSGDYTGEKLQTINYNLGILYGFQNKNTEARNLFETLMSQAISSRNKELQGHMMNKLALIKAKQGRFHEGEQDIILRAVPHFRQLRNSQGAIGLVDAYMTLAEIYRLQSRYPEAQWFLLQARDVANERHLRSFMPDIVFALAEVKRASGNTEVALDEYRLVENMLHGRSDSLLIRLAIADAVGNIHHRHGDHELALEAQDQFDELKNQLISSDFLF